MASLLEIRDLRVEFPVRGGVFRRVVDRVAAVDGVTLTLDGGETVGLVGESGSGKTTVARTVVGLQQATAGEILVDGRPLVTRGPRSLRAQAQDMQMIFQDPYASLNPRLTVAEIIAVAWRIQGIRPEGGYRRATAELLERVGLKADFAGRYPHQFSGGQRQRIGIARALALRPRLIVCDEAVSALDVSIRAQIINLLEDLQQEYGIAYLFIAHDLSVVEHLCPKVAVMHKGRVVEQGSTDQIFSAPQHEYTRKLLAAVPVTYPWRAEEAAR